MPASRRRQASQAQSSVSNEAHSVRQKLTTSKGFERHFAKHDYHDFARCQPSELDELNLKPIRGGVQSPFPVVLHRMLEDSGIKNFAGIVSWQSHGRAFLIRQPKEFVASVLPKYFKHSKLSSFQRQLSLYGFIRLTHDGADRGAYYHEAFLRGREFLCSKIRRTRIKGTWIRTSSSPTEEPNFYLMEPVFDLNATRTAPTNTNFLSTMKFHAVSDEDSSAQSNDTQVQAPPLQPPPPLVPSNVVRPMATQNLSMKMAPSPPQASLASMASMQWFPKVVECDNNNNNISNQRFGFGSFTMPNMIDNDIAQFLTGVDLDIDEELSFSEVIQMSPV
ncbi:unnamed protein product [Cylindrotheca closterium]|uniref:HSF-type DNA-binding domain-containing protein n=1 Tax=Cylindrotheca closterium TaxID=2856 RepID=A0AAD2C9Q6_9STRA|nr:unnamed protein product [Cylindrotheca closterium]